MLYGQACRIEEAESQRVLHVTFAARGMSPEAVRLSLEAMLQQHSSAPAPLPSGGLELALVDRRKLRHGMLCNGEVLLEFDSHAEALAAAHALSGDPRVVVGWALPGEWQGARPRLPIYF